MLASGYFFCCHYKVGVRWQSHHFGKSQSTRPRILVHQSIKCLIWPWSPCQACCIAVRSTPSFTLLHPAGLKGTTTMWTTSHTAKTAATTSSTVLVKYHSLSRAVVTILKAAATLSMRDTVPSTEDVAWIADAALLGRERAVVGGIGIDTGSWTSCALGLKVAVGWAGDF